MYHLDRVYNNMTGRVEKCYQACELQTETILSSTSSYPSRNVYPSVPAFCVVFVKIRDRLRKVGEKEILLQIAAKKRVFENYYKDVIACELFEKKAV